MDLVLLLENLLYVLLPNRFSSVCIVKYDKEISVLGWSHLGCVVVCANRLWGWGG